MKRTQGFRLVVLLGLIVSGMVAFAASPAGAATAAGPYYANPSWDQQLPPSTRFIVLSNWSSAAVLDRETGLVWEQSPSTFAVSWFVASSNCIDLNAGGRKGWRLPTIQELMSLIDRSSFPALPSGHPFSNVQGSYWSATTLAKDAAAAWAVFFDSGDLFRSDKNANDFFWCVRGGQGVDPQ